MNQLRVEIEYRDDEKRIFEYDRVIFFIDGIDLRNAISSDLANTALRESFHVPVNDFIDEFQGNYSPYMAVDEERPNQSKALLWCSCGYDCGAHILAEIVKEENTYTFRNFVQKNTLDEITKLDTIPEFKFTKENFESEIEKLLTYKQNTA